jgi:hypothetical protein
LARRRASVETGPTRARRREALTSAFLAAAIGVTRGIDASETAEWIADQVAAC